MEAIQEIVKQIPAALGQFLINYGFIAVVYFIVWKLLKTRLRNWRIQLKERVDAKQIKSEIINSLLRPLILFCRYEFN
jgi:hypothetical protein